MLAEVLMQRYLQVELLDRNSAMFRSIGFVYELDGKDRIWTIKRSSLLDTD